MTIEFPYDLSLSPDGNAAVLFCSNQYIVMKVNCASGISCCSTQRTMAGVLWRETRSNSMIKNTSVTEGITMCAGCRPAPSLGLFGTAVLFMYISFFVDKSDIS